MYYLNKHTGAKLSEEQYEEIIFGESQAYWNEMGDEEKERYGSFLEFVDFMGSEDQDFIPIYEGDR